MPDMFCYTSVCKSRVANISIQATRDVYFWRNHTNKVNLRETFAEQSH